ncbi:MAG: tetratricopeptide repeat protein [Verrucomicrobiota bacterium]
MIPTFFTLRRLGLRCLPALLLPIALFGQNDAAPSDDALSAAPGAPAPTNYSSMGTSDLSDLVERMFQDGQAEQALPAVEALLERIEAFEQPEQRAPLESLYFLHGVSLMRNYSMSPDPELLQRAIESFDKALEEFPRTDNRHFIVMNRADCYRGLGEFGKAADDLELLLKRPLVNQLNQSQLEDTREKIVEAYYIQRNWEEGIPWFKAVITQGDEDAKGQAASALVEAYIETGEFGGVMQLLPLLTQAGDQRYSIQFNLSLIEGGDKLSENGRFQEAALLYYLALGRTQIIEHLDRRIRELQAEVRDYRSRGTRTDYVAELEIKLEATRKRREQMDEIQDYTPDLEWRRARNFYDTGRTYEAFWAFERLAEDYPDDQDRIEDFRFLMLSMALENEMWDRAEEIAEKYLAGGLDKYEREIKLMMIQATHKRENWERFTPVAEEFLENESRSTEASFIAYLYGDSLMKQDKIEKLIEEFDALKEAHPNAPIAQTALYWGALGRLFIQDYEGAEERFRALLDANAYGPFSEDAHFRLGVSVFGQQEYERASRIFLKFIQERPASNLRGEAEAFTGDCLAALGQADEALEHYQSVPQHTMKISMINHATFQAGKLLEANKRFSEMASLFRDYIETYGDRGKIAEATFRLGKAYEHLGQPQRMIEEYVSAITEFGNDPDRYGVDDILDAYPDKYAEYSQRFSDTIAVLERLISDRELRREILPQDGRRKAFSFFADHPNLAKDVRQALLFDPEFRRQALRNTSALEEWLTEYQELQQRFPSQDPTARLSEEYKKARQKDQKTLQLRLQMALENIGAQPENAILVFSPSDLQVASPATLIWMGNKLLDDDTEGSRDMARQAFERVTERYPDADEMVVEATFALGNYYLAAERYDQAIDLFNKLQTELPSGDLFGPSILREADALRLMGRYDEAMEGYDTILRMRRLRGEMWAEATYKKGLCLYESARFNDARAWFERTYIAHAGFKDWAIQGILMNATALNRLGNKDGAREVIDYGYENFDLQNSSFYRQVRELEVQL